MDRRSPLSPHFTLAEMCHTDHRGINNMPDQDSLLHLVTLCNNYLEPIRDEFGPLLVTSGFRCKLLNDQIGGVHSSAHTLGCAADFISLQWNLDEVFDWIHRSTLDFDQVIYEHSDEDGDWIHIGMLRPGYEKKPRHEVLKYDKELDHYITL